MENIPYYVSITFIACVIATFAFIYYAISVASGDSKSSSLPTVVTTFLAVWLFVTALLTFTGFFGNFDARPPRMILFVGFLILVIIFVFLNSRSRRFLEKMPITTLTYIHIIRVPVEIVLWWLFLQGAVSVEMTFEGMNYDILSGISAPFAGLFFVGMKSKSKFAAIIWNLITLGLLINIVFRAILTTPYFFDPLIFDQPNMAVFYFPYVWLPTFIVPAILFAHLVSLYKLIVLKEEEF